jgi:hypothetical protein
MNIELTEVYSHNRISNSTSVSKQSYSLRVIFVNPKHVVCMRHDAAMGQHLSEGLLPEDLDTRTGFTKLYINRGQSGLDVTVVGSPDIIQKKIDETTVRQKVLLKG